MKRKFAALPFECNNLFSDFFIRVSVKSDDQLFSFSLQTGVLKRVFLTFEHCFSWLSQQISVEKPQKNDN